MHNPRTVFGGRGGGRRWVVPVLVVIATAGPSLALGACGGAARGTPVAGGRVPSTTTVPVAAPGTGTNDSRQALAYATCMRKHGEPGFPDPDSAGSFPIAQLRQLDRSSPQYQTALHDCQDARPRPSATEIAQDNAELLRFSTCMRAHGEPRFPDLDLGSGGAAQTMRTYLKTIDPGSPQFESALGTCRHLLPPTIAAAIGS
jgi:hypothetical protein